MRLLRGLVFKALTLALALMVVMARPADSLGGEAEEIRALAALIDRHLETKLVENGVSPAGVADDATFLRRVRLDLTGVIPTVMETRRFLEDPDPDKRLKVVERLLKTPSNKAHFAKLWAKQWIPEIDDNNIGRFAAVEFEAWLRGKLVSNASYDSIVKDILTVKATGAQMAMFGGAAEPSAATFYMAKQSKPENLGAAVSRTFLGIRLECAQCHNHPFETWKREQFWEFAAFFAGFVPSPNADAFIPPNEVVSRRELTIPDTKKTVKPKFLNGGEPKLEKGVSARNALADWLVAPSNPWFSKVTANRIWAHMMGFGIVDPVDDFSESNTPSHPELLDLLAKELANHQFKTDFLIKAIAASKAYQRSSQWNSAAAPEPELFARMALKGLPARQLVASVSRAAGFLDAQDNNNFFGFGANDPRSRFLDRFERKNEAPVKSETSILQALAIMNGDWIHQATKPDSSPTLAAIVESPFLSKENKIETLFLAVLSRKPRPDESAKMLAFWGDRPASTALSEIMWVLFNTPEFAINH